MGQSSTTYGVINGDGTIGETNANCEIYWGTIEDITENDECYRINTRWKFFKLKKSNPNVDKILETLKTETFPKFYYYLGGFCEGYFIASIITERPQYTANMVVGNIVMKNRNINGYNNYGMIASPDVFTYEKTDAHKFCKNNTVLIDYLHNKLEYGSEYKCIMTCIYKGDAYTNPIYRIDTYTKI
jgi:hypothetical protein